MADKKKTATYSRPSDVVGSDGRVLVDGPDAVDVALTPEAADETAKRLAKAAKDATKAEPPKE